MDAKAIQDARNFLRAFRSVFAFAETVDALGTLEADMASARTAYEALIAETQNAKAELEAVRLEKAGAHDEADSIRADARKEAKRVKEQSALAATAALKKCTDDCNDLVNSAKTKASDADKRLAKATKELEQKQAELAEVEKQLAAAKAQLSELLARFK